MKEVKIKLKVDDTEAVQATKDIEKGLKGVSDEASKTDKEVEAIGVTAGNTKVGFNIMSKAITKVGFALKAAGIGLVIALIAGLTEAFSRNKRVMDGINIVLGTIQEVFSQVTDALIATYDAVAQSSDNFDALGKVMSGILTLVLTPYKFAFFQIQLALQAAQLAWEDSFFGGGDEEKMAQLRLDIEDTKKSIIEVAVEAVDAGKDIVNNFSEAVSEVGNIAEITSENLSKVSIKAASETAKAHKAATDAAIIAQAMAAKNIALFDRQAEQQRQIRDDANKSIKERQEANVKLGEILEKQEEALLKQAAAVEAGARADVARNDSIENRAALIAAEAASAQVLADIEGKRSEQKSNTNTLLLEEKGLITSVTNAEKERNKIKRDFEAEQELDPLAKLQKQKSALELENTAILEDLEAKRLLYAEGTQQRVDAEQDYLNQKQGIDNQLVANTTATNKQITENDKATADAKAAIQDASLGTIKNGLNLLKQLGEDSKVLQATALIGESAVGIAEMVINKSKADLAAQPLLTNPATATAGATALLLNKINLGIGIATNVAATAKGLAALGKGGAPAGGSEGAEGGGATAPAFNLVEGTESNAIQDSITNQENAVKAIVVSGDVTTAQSADRNAIDSSGF
jgi:hypothetical protein